MVEQGCGYRPLAPEILQRFAVGTSTSGMSQKASVPGPVGVKGHLLALHRDCSVSPVSGFVLSPPRKSGRQPAGVCGSRSPRGACPSALTARVAGPQPGARLGSVCLLNLSVLVMRWGHFLFHFQIEMKVYNEC